MKDKKILNLENKLTLCENQSTVNNLEKKLTLRENQSTVKNIEKNPTLRENQSTVKEGLEKRDISSNVAFYARLSQDVTLGKHSTVIFDSEITNYGGGYHSFDGIFICPRSGVYLFTTTILVHSGQWIRAFIVVNGSPVAESIVHSEGGYESGSTTVIVHLQNNDHVYVRTQDDSDWVLRASVTSFAGVLLF
ncbi:complement C1q-like protein 4 [Saccostrea echinata]|uniref:complement C1q-like protein 4 n=1 Tax=Saccostrea echinata TaxID=191078 RepID=UPI002A800A80|nr:complement C1q-like protein 4 [Saccostrea echinata]